MKDLFHPSVWFLISHGLILPALCIRVIMRRPATGVALSWLFLIAALPGLGAIAYLLIGEKRIGKERIRRLALLKESFIELSKVLEDRGLTNVDWGRHPEEAQGMDRMGRLLVGLPTVCGAEGHLYGNTEEILTHIAADVKGASRSVLMEFYIWNEGGLADDVLNAVVSAAGRGVTCRLLIDALGASPWWKGEQPQRLRDAGVSVRKALPTGAVRLLFGRNDVRLHRKIVIIDDGIAWTGSMNLVDPHFFKQDAHVGEWVDAMVRMEGSAVAPLALTMIGDWNLETGESVIDVAKDAGFHQVDRAGEGDGDVQIVPSGPGQTGDGLLQMLLSAVNSAREELILTTPYFVPDDSLLRAIRGAGARGVKVSMVVPEKVDSLLTRYASRSFYDELMECGVKIYLYKKGLLHTKSICADRRISMFGTVNLDMRSIWINYEVASFIYGREFGEELHTLQQSYIDDSELLDTGKWGRRSNFQKFLEDFFRLSSPLL